MRKTGDMSDTYLKRSHHDSVSPEESHGPMEIDALMIISPPCDGITPLMRPVSRYTSDIYGISFPVSDTPINIQHRTP